MPNQTLNAAIAATRFGLGARPGEIDRTAPDPAGYLIAQIRAAGADQPPGDPAPTRERIAAYLAFVDARRAINRQFGAGTITADGKKTDIRDARLDIVQTINADMLARAQLAATTDCAFRERWAWFWANHFTVSGHKADVLPIAASFERDAIRPHVFGRFRDMAAAVLHHPAMLSYLDQGRSVGPDSVVGRRKNRGLNENLARETLELHTLGAESGYTQADVTEFARALTGFTVETRRNGSEIGRSIFDADAHEPGTRTVMGRTYRQADAAQAEAILRDAADDPRTARHVCTKLAAHFVADAPPPELVAALEQAWLRSGSDLAVVAHALVTAPAAWTPVATKFKTPYEFLISCHRACDSSPSEIGAVRPVLIRFGQPAFSPPSPKGWPDEAGAWATSDAILDRLAFADRFAAGEATQRDPIATAQGALGARLSQPVQLAMQRAESRGEALTLLFMSPEFQRR